MYSICTKSGEVVKTCETIEAANKAIKGNGHLHIRYSQKAIDLESRRRRHLASGMTESAPVFLNGDSEVIELAAKMAPLYEKHVQDHFNHMRSKNGDHYIVSKPVAFAGA